MAGVPFWTDLIPNPDPQSFTNPPDIWSVVQLGNGIGGYIPGLLQDGDIPFTKPPHRTLDRKKAPSADGENPAWLGFGCAEWDLPMIIWTPGQLQQLDALLPLIWGGKTGPQGGQGVSSAQGVAPGNGIPGATQTIGLNLTANTQGGATLAYVTDGPQAISHPSLTMFGITSCLILKVTPLHRFQGDNIKKRYIIHCREYRASKPVSTPTPRQPIGKAPTNPNTLPKNKPQTPPSSNASGPNPTLG